MTAIEDGFVSIPASEDPDDLWLDEWEDLDFALGDVSVSTWRSVFTVVHRIKRRARAEAVAVEREHIASAIEAERDRQPSLTPSAHLNGYTQAARIARAGGTP